MFEAGKLHPRRRYRLCAPDRSKTGPSPEGAVVTPDQGPRAALRPPAPGSFSAGRPPLLDARGSHDPSGQIARYLWYFGDGRTLISTRPGSSDHYRHPGN